MKIYVEMTDEEYLEYLDFKNGKYELKKEENEILDFSTLIFLLHYNLLNL